MITVESIIQNSERISWKLNELLPLNHTFNLAKSFIPTLDTFEHPTLLSQLRAIEYARLIHIVEEFIIDQVMLELKPHSNQSPQYTRLMCRFADEELKHQLLFSRFTSILSKQINTKIIIPDTSKDFSLKISNKHPISIWLLALHSEVATQFHYSEIFQHRNDIEASFLNILKKHWQEEIQHIDTDCLVIDNFLKNASENEKAIVLNDYAELVELLDNEVLISSEVILENYSNCVSQACHKDDVRNYLLKGHRDFFIKIALRHPQLTEIISKIDPVSGLALIKSKLK